MCAPILICTHLQNYMREKQVRGLDEEACVAAYEWGVDVFAALDGRSSRRRHKTYLTCLPWGGTCVEIVHVVSFIVLGR